MTRRDFVAATLAATAPRPNVILILADDLGYGDLGCNGSTTLRTPHIDRLAADGVRFTDHYTGSPVCSPARASLLTGMVPDRTGVMGVLRDDGDAAPVHLSRPPETCRMSRSSWHPRCLPPREKGRHGGPPEDHDNAASDGGVIEPTDIGLMQRPDIQRLKMMALVFAKRLARIRVPLN